MTDERFLWYPRRGYSCEIITVLLAMLFICYLQKSVRLKIIPKYLICFDQGTEWLNDLHSGRRLHERRVKVFLLSCMD
jgi:hypothetical protein